MKTLNNNIKNINNTDYNKLNNTNNIYFFDKLRGYILEQKPPIFKRDNNQKINKLIFEEVFNEIKQFENDFEKLKNKFTNLRYEPDNNSKYPNQNWWIFNYNKYYFKIEFIENNQIEVLSAH